MIVSFLLNILYTFLNALVSILPTGSLPPQISSGILYFWSLLNSFSYIIPVNTMLAAVGVILIFDAGVLVWHLIQWVIRKIPGMQ